MVGKALEALQMRSLYNGNFLFFRLAAEIQATVSSSSSGKHSLVGLYFRLDIRFTSQSSIVVKDLW